MQGPARRPFVAGFLSFLWPGLGQWYDGHRAAALVHALPILVVFALLVSLLARGLQQLVALLFTPYMALALVAIIVVAGAWRLASMALAWRDAGQPAIHGSAVGVWDAADETSTRPALRDQAAFGALMAVVVLVHLLVVSWVLPFHAAGEQIFQPSTGVPATPAPTLAPGATPSPARTGRVNVLIVGIDASPVRERDHQLTDTLMLASFDPVAHRIDMVSLPRDTARFPLFNGLTYDGKINELMSWAKDHPAQYPEGPMGTVIHEMSFLLGVDIHYFASIDLLGFRTLIDTLGGIDIVNEEEIDDPTYQFSADRIGFHLAPGPHHLNGEDALAYVRSRKGVGGSDFERGRRQQKFILALRQKLEDPAILTRLPEVLAAVTETVRTDLPAERIPEMMELARLSQGARTKHVVLGSGHYATQIPPDQIRGLYALKLDIAAVADLSRRLWGEESYYWDPDYITRVDPDASAPPG